MEMLSRKHGAVDGTDEIVKKNTKQLKLKKVVFGRGFELLKQSSSVCLKSSDALASRLRYC